jgi:hypothetical protein
MKVKDEATMPPIEEQPDEIQQDILAPRPPTTTIPSVGVLATMKLPDKEIEKEVLIAAYNIVAGRGEMKQVNYKPYLQDLERQISKLT